MKFNCLVLSLVLLATAAQAADPQYPDHTGYVNDYAGVLDQGVANKLEELCRTLEKKTSAELAVAIVRSVAPLDSKEYAVKLFEKWKIGKQGKDNGILLLLAMDERRVEIEVGYGLEGVINDAKAGEILDRYVVPAFKQGEFGDGLYNGAAAIAQQISGAAGQELGEEYQPSTPVVAEEEEAPGWVTAMLVVFFLLTVMAHGIWLGLLGALIGGVIGFTLGGVIGAAIGAPIGFVVSYFRFPGIGWSGDTWSGGMGGGGGGGGFGGFGGGGSGGGGAGRSW